VNAIYVWGIASARGGRVLMRIEDHDRIRSRPEFEAAILEDLEWLGFLTGGLKASGYEKQRIQHQRQSDRNAIYQDALASLRRTHHVYACDCSRKEIGGERYPGTCRDRGLAETAGRGVRIAIAPGLERFVDLRLGPQEQSPADQCGDLLLRDRDGQWTYQFAVTVDDMLHGITHVIRGADLLSSTGRQLRLARMLGRTEMPLYSHHPLIRRTDGRKLSKSSADTGIRELRRAAFTPAEVIRLASTAAGLGK
jgi:glutamyl/glutaminyl-tRNA synthetase